ncbi:hypothetical protein QBC32DRAFT_315709 [Pseudoneurospora amorphoporcata]|uniref:Ecp2 effector protein-like domain-containing protein n=1 Tax=Pseudoneurospora amorphoporcata TaxID=241081 RepID=A0AAN6NR60_9PEZI|nr:hypothetical protein QBC32DRAFT_315709 [Pseudoneurospora amorphoporcata]
MSTFSIRSLAQLALVGISTAAAIAPSAITAPPDSLITREDPNDSPDMKHKRVEWQEFGLNDPIQDFCWDESRPQFTYGSSAPLAADCQKIVDYYSGIRGRWTLYPSDLANGKVVPLVKVEGCQFTLALSGELGHKVFWGDNDLVYYVSNQLRYAKDGRVQAEDYTAFFVMDEKYVQLKWRLVKA